MEGERGVLGPEDVGEAGRQVRANRYSVLLFPHQVHAFYMYLPLVDEGPTGLLRLELLLPSLARVQGIPFSTWTGGRGEPRTDVQRSNLAPAYANVRL